MQQQKQHGLIATSRQMFQLTMLAILEGHLQVPSMFLLFCLGDWTSLIDEWMGVVFFALAVPEE